jgi:hypothetical protein
MTLLALWLGALSGWLAPLVTPRTFRERPSVGRACEMEPDRAWSFPSRPRLTTFDVERWSPQGRPPGAIVVPTIRPGTQPRSGLRLAARLAAEVGCPLVVLVSKDAATSESIEGLRAQLAEDLAARTLVVRVADSPGKWTRFAVDRLEISRLRREAGDGSGVPSNDTGRKRSLAILLARSMGWSSILLLDDDVYTDVETGSSSCVQHASPGGRTLDATTLRAAAAAVESGEHAVVGFVVQDFDDNSVLFRMCKVLGEKPTQFIGGGAMICRVDRHTPFFSSIYNEDWLFLLAHVLSQPNRRAWAEAGTLHQDPYPPYEASRADSEELGDLLGEGMMSLVTDGAGEIRIAGVHYWWAMIRQRMALRAELAAAVETSEDPEKEDMALALKSVAGVHDELDRHPSFWCHQFVSYQYTLRRDLRRWSRSLRRPPRPRALFRSNEVVPGGVSVLPGSPGRFVRVHKARRNGLPGSRRLSALLLKAGRRVMPRRRASSFPGVRADGSEPALTSASS